MAQCPPATPPVLINEIHYNPPAALDPGDWVELYNPNANPVDLSGYELRDEGGLYVIPAATVLPAGGYLVLVRNTIAFAAVYPGLSNYIGPIPFGLSGAGEEIKLLTNTGCTLDSVNYDDVYPWPVAADGNGPSLELINSGLDNALPGSWVASPVTNGTPGAAYAGAFDPCHPLPPAPTITEINYSAPDPVDPGDWVEIYNPNASAVDLSGWKLSDGTGVLTLPLGLSLASHSYLVLVRDSLAFASRYPAVNNYIGSLPFGLSAKGDQVILSSPYGCVVDGVVYDNSGEWPKAPDGNGPTLALTNLFLNNDLPTSWGSEWKNGGSPGTGNTIRPDPCWPTLPPPLLISEVNYQSDTINAHAGDWVEIHNPTTSMVDASLYQLQDESGAKFFLPPGTLIPAGGYFVMVQDSALFMAQHASVSNFAGQTGFALSNNGQRLRVYSPTYCLVDELTYNDLPPWPLSPNGLGFTLSLADTATSNDSSAQWGGSLTLGGTPGTANTLAPDCPNSPPTLVINEVNYNSLLTFDPGDWVEIYNPNASPVDLSGWVLMDETNGYRVPDGIVLPANGYFVLVEDSLLFEAQFPAVNNFAGNLGFTFKGTGEQIFLLDPDFCVVDHVEYEATAPWPLAPAGKGPTLSLTDAALDNSLPGSWLPSASTGGTPGSANDWVNPCAPVPQNVVINEINYNSDPAFDPSNWIELYNPNAFAVNLSNWELHTDSAVYTFPTNTTIAANGYLILTENPFLFAFQFPGVAPYVGPVGFGLQNTGERLLLYNSNWCLTDSVRFNDKSPWPVLGDGKGPAIALREPTLDNALGQNWLASPGNGTPGRKNVPDPCYPGRIDQGLLLWLKADAGTSSTTDGQGISAWNDQSGLGSHFYQLSASQQPQYHASPDGFNGHPAIFFDDLDDGMYGSLNLANPYTLFIVYNLETFPQDNARALDGDDWLVGPFRQRHSMYAGGWVTNAADLANGDNRPVVAMAYGSGFVSQFYVNGLNQTAGFASSAPGLLFMGASGPTEEPLGGYIAEVIVYNRNLSPGERNDIATYLATKYGVGLDQSAHRYYHEADYGHDLAGVGRDSVQCFLQTTSRCVNDHSRLTISIDPDSLPEQSYLTLGHNGWGMGEDTDTTRLPDGIVARCNRIWNVAAYGEPGPVRLAFDLKDLGYSLDKLQEFVLLVDGGDNFNNSEILSSRYHFEGDEVVFEDVVLQHGDHISLARRANVGLDLHLWLQGPYDVPTQLMRDDLRAADLIPREEPYTALPGYARVGEGGAERLSDELLAISGPTAMVDWIWVELRAAANNTQILAARPALLRRDGKVVDTDGLSALSFPGLAADDYYVVVRHRNHLGAMTANPLALSETVLPFDFASGATFGLHAQRSLSAGVYGLWAGNANGDGQLLFQGTGNDPSIVFLHVLSAPGNSSFARNYVLNAYHTADVNMDGQLIFQGGSSDTTPIFLNVLSHPANASFSRNHIVQEQLP